MSILNVYLRRDAALVGVDTEGASLNGAFNQCSKMLPIPHASAVLACRGSSVILACTFVQMLITDCDDFDALAARFPDAANRASKKLYGPLMRHIRKADFRMGDELVLIGYSPSRKRMRAIELLRDSGECAFKADETEGHYVTPWHPSLADMPYPVDLLSMGEMAQAQVNLIKKENPKFAAGGNLLIAELFENRMTFRKLWALRGPAEIAPA